MLENDLYYIENKEIEEDSAIFYCEIIKCKNIKFLNVVSPVDHPNITYKINWNALEDNIFNLKVDIFQGEDTFSKMNIEVRTK